ncbi:hypothetical protein PTSG_12176 [Salpingoeca rosetta]|uniref:Uncharacterized protein n=1 Tax=Salpingoeca rosetta (strain ATCC 50818 / BSB-021) TaxID=946362 RepID=F2U8K4_SALR5|nr:uncharacterized protein PTSG_12176 [Salpingoeca rosetta]EGD72712.1 hypothetical protein PTSG_12176 [Salpingoeca rosetta]|eukprot:XP_004994535.1 hypothetical protein PTSG_12176 [Salpingoeca rosetta]
MGLRLPSPPVVPLPPLAQPNTPNPAPLTGIMISLFLLWFERSLYEKRSLFSSVFPVVADATCVCVSSLSVSFYRTAAATYTSSPLFSFSSPLGFASPPLSFLFPSSSIVASLCNGITLICRSGMLHPCRCPRCLHATLLPPGSAVTTTLPARLHGRVCVSAAYLCLCMYVSTNVCTCFCVYVLFSLPCCCPLCCGPGSFPATRATSLPLPSSVLTMAACTHTPCARVCVRVCVPSWFEGDFVIGRCQ